MICDRATPLINWTRHTGEKTV